LITNQEMGHTVTKRGSNYSCVLIGPSIAILYFLARKITAKDAGVRREGEREILPPTSRYVLYG